MYPMVMKVVIPARSSVLTSLPAQIHISLIGEFKLGNPRKGEKTQGHKGVVQLRSQLRRRFFRLRESSNNHIPLGGIHEPSHGKGQGQGRQKFFTPHRSDTTSLIDETFESPADGKDIHSRHHEIMRIMDHGREESLLPKSQTGNEPDSQASRALIFFEHREKG